MIKKVTAWAAIICMVTCCGCSNEKQQVDNGEKKTLTYWCDMGNAAASLLSSYNDLELYQKAQEIAGVEIKFKHPPVGQQEEQFNLMIASRDLADLIETDWQKYSGGPQKAITDGVIIDISQYIDKNAPNFKKVLDDNEIVRKQSKTDGNQYYAFPAVGIGTVTTTSGPMLRKDWLEELGLSRPETLDEWETVLTAFKNQKGAQAPFSATSNTMLTLDCFSGAYGVGLEYYLDNGTVKYGPVEPAFRAYVEKMRDWYSKGLLDPDVFANNAKTLEANVVNERTGALFGSIGGVMGTYTNTMKLRNPNFQLEATMYPVMQKGDSPRFIQRAWEVRNSGMLALSTKNPSPELSVKFADLFYSEEGMLLKNFGIEGVSYEMKDGYPAYTDLILHNPDGLSVSQALSKYTRASAPSPGLIDKRYHEQYYQMQEQKDAIALWQGVSDNALAVTLPPLTPTQQESEELSNIKSNVSSYFEEQFTKVVMGVLPMEAYDTAVAEMEKMGIRRALEIYQDAYGRYQKR